MNKYLSHWKFIILVYLAISHYSCGVKREALGSDDEIIVVSAMEDESDLNSILSTIFNDTLFAPEPEPYYKLKFVSPQDYNRIKNSTQIVVGAIGKDPSNPAVDLIKNLLSRNQYHNSLSGEKPIIISKDPYARNQLLMVINTPNIDKAMEYAMKNNDIIKNQYFSLFKNRQEKYLFNNARQKELENHLLNDYGWTLKIPWGYEVIVDSSEQQLFWIGREMPFRWLAVHWRDGAIVENYDSAKEFIMGFPLEYFKNIQYSADYFKLFTTNKFNQRLAWKVNGLWESIDDTQGGPFLAYLFYDGITDKTYYIHAMVFHPGSNKVIHLQQLDLIARSFTVDN